MRVTHVVGVMSMTDGGPTEVVRRLHESLPAFGVDSHVVTTDRRHPDVSALTGTPGLTVVSSRPPARYNYAPGMREALDARLRCTDVLHVHSVDTHNTTVAIRLAARHGVPVVLQPHGAYDAYHRRQNALVKAAYLRLVDRRYLLKSKEIVTSSSREADGVREVLKRSSKVIPLGVDPLLFDLDRTPVKAGQVLFLGRLTEKKSVDLVIRAFASSNLHRTGVRLIVAGPRDPRLPYDPIALVDQLGIRDGVSFVGEVDGGARADLLASSDLFVLPSLDESFGVSAAEAMAAGCAVVTSADVGLAPDAARADALVVALRSEDALSLEMSRLMSDETARRGLSERARAYARANFDWQKICLRFRDVYVAAAA